MWLVSSKNLGIWALFGTLQIDYRLQVRAHLETAGLYRDIKLVRMTAPRQEWRLPECGLRLLRSGSTNVRQPMILKGRSH